MAEERNTSRADARILPSRHISAVESAVEWDHQGTGLGVQNPATDTPFFSSADLRSLKEVEEEHIRRVLATCDGNKAKSARILGINRVTLYRKLKEIGLA